MWVSITGIHWMNFNETDIWVNQRLLLTLEPKPLSEPMLMPQDLTELQWMSLDFIDDQSTLVKVLAWCHEADPDLCCHMASPGHNELTPSDAIQRCRTGSTLAQVMACYLTAPSHYLNLCWLEIIGIHPSVISQKNVQNMTSKVIIWD